LEEKTQQLLRSGLEELGITLADKQVKQLLQHIALLDKWNRVHNLTAIRAINDMVGKHVLDSLSVLPELVKQSPPTMTLADVGTGAGFPGLPLAIACPDWQVTLIDSNHKKIGFIKQVVHVGDLKNVTVIASRVEQQTQTFAAVISRAFASLAEMVKHTKPVCREDTVLWAMKGKYPEQELSELPKPYIVSGAYPLVVPQCEGERHLLRIIKGHP
jgi:16S rRNA (guanine527-N7)-methyltransferase